MNTNTDNNYSFIDLFAGAGGLSEGFIQMGFTPIAHVEKESDACATLKTREAYHYLTRSGKSHIYDQYLKGEITKDEFYSAVPEDVLDTVINETMSKDSMPSLVSKIEKLLASKSLDHIDVIIGGPPCQAYSLVGRAVKGEKMKDDPRNHLYELYIMVLHKFKPKMFVFENVPGILTAGDGAFFEDIKQKFAAEGYTLGYSIVNANDFGVLQNRKRVILIGWQENLDIEYPSFALRKMDYNVDAILKDLPAIQGGEKSDHYRVGNYSNYLKETGIRKSGDVLTWHVARPNIERDKEIYRTAISLWNDEGKRLRYTDLPESLQNHRNMSAFLDRFKVVAANLPASQTMMAHISKDGHYFIHPDINQVRSISVREAARIQSFPDDFYFEGSRTAAFTQIGNAVPPLMAKGIAEAIKNSLESCDE